VKSNPSFAGKALDLIKPLLADDSGYVRESVKKALISIES
jgi:hypothetical protein